jgi:hypothetical protein
MSSGAGMINLRKYAPDGTDNAILGSGDRPLPPYGQAACFGRSGSHGILPAQPPMPLRLSVSTLQGTRFDVHCQSTDTVLDLKRRIGERMKGQYNPQAQRVAAKSLDLLEHKQLFHYGFMNGEQVNVGRM